MDAQFLSFIAFCSLLAITPGADMALVTKNTLNYSHSGGLITIAGIILGILSYGFITSSGLAYLLVNNKVLLLTIKYLGAFYLLYLGLCALYTLRKAGPSPSHTTIHHYSTTPYKKLFCEGFITNILNPKIIVFYLSVIPQFIDFNSASFLAIYKYAFTNVIIGGSWLYAYSTLIHKANHILLKPRLRKTIEGVTGLVMVAFGLKLIFDGK